MQETGVHNGAYGANKFGFKKLENQHWNLGAPQLYEHALRSGEAGLSGIRYEPVLAWRAAPERAHAPLPCRSASFQSSPAVGASRSKRTPAASAMAACWAA